MELRLSNIRELVGVSQQTIADQLNIAQSSVAGLEAKDKISGDMIEHYLHILEYDYIKEDNSSAVKNNIRMANITGCDYIRSKENYIYLVKYNKSLEFYRYYKDNLRYLRNCAGLTQKQLAEMSGIQQSTIAQYESGRKKVSRQTFWRFVDAMGYNFIDRYHISINGREISPLIEISFSDQVMDMLVTETEKNLIEKYRHLSDIDQLHIREQINILLAR